MAHTKGTWEVTPDENTFIWANGFGIGQAYRCGDLHLMGAAPDMLEALKMAEGTIATFRPEATVTLQCIRAAIAKAQGKP